MADQIPQHVASSVLGILGDLRSKLVPFVTDIVHKASSGSIDIAEHTAQNVLDEVRTKLTALEAEIKKHAPPGV